MAHHHKLSLTHTHTHSSAEHILALLTWLTITNKLTHIEKQHTLTHIHTHTLTHAPRNMYKKAWICSAEEFLELYGKVEAMVRNCLLRWSGHLFEVPSTHIFDQCFCFKHISLFYAPIRAFFRWYPPFLCCTKDFTCRSGVNLNLCTSATNQNFEKWKKVFLIRVVGMYHKNFKHLLWLESIEVDRRQFVVFYTQKKSPFSGVFFLRFSQEPPMN